MAQEVGYFENNVVFKEGPFVICNPLGNGWRIEVELKDHYCPILPGVWYTSYIKKHGFEDGKYWDKDYAVRLCDFLNDQVRNEDIVLVDNRTWLPKTNGRLMICPECTHEFYVK